MPKKVAPELLQQLDKHQDAIVEAFREAVKANVASWHQQHIIERLIGPDVELNLGDLINYVTAGIDQPDAVSLIKPADIMKWIKEKL